ncbi:hypothetical protein G7Z17_g6449 [Cylindrodendrum hubeiense]|uniref:Uncharacterized protein n=1 Tax=Cylindrodendrum hubeiense TaxID=595255 RepID=A0A9P5HB04_9HYPO|nr:hypothetical protein G7Z17_g6449 [Cylindrodendrum hubeiense]
MVPYDFKQVNGGDHVFHNMEELAKFRRWVRGGFCLLAFLFLWNIVLSLGLTFSPRGHVPSIATFSQRIASPFVELSPSDIHIEDRESERVEFLEALPTSGHELSTRDAELLGFEGNTALALRGFGSALGAYASWVGVKNMIGDCRDASEDATLDSVNTCVAGVIGACIIVGSSLTFGYHSLQMIGSIKELVEVWTTYPYGSPEKRGLEDTMSEHMGIEVRHIGNWDASMHWVSSEPQEQINEWPVFGLNHEGHDFHVALIGDDHNETTFHIGHGAGPDTEGNRRLRNRSFDFSKAYFAEGGFDFKIQSMPDANDKKFFIDDNQADKDWVFSQVKCWVDNWMPVKLSGFVFDSIGDIYDAATDYKAVEFQVYNDYQKTTLSAGVIVPFTEGTRSKINEVKIEQGITRNAECSTRD